MHTLGMVQQIISIALPVSLILVMTGVGMSLEIKDFRRVAKFPKAFVLGAFCLLLLPLLALGVISVFQLSGALAFGVLIIALCPGGVTSNLFTYLARGDVGLSVSLTAIVGFITPFTIPLVLNWGIGWLSLDSEGVSLPVVNTILTLFVISVLPIPIGMWLRSWLREKVEKDEPFVRVVSVGALGLVIVALYFEYGVQTINSYAILTGPSCVALNLLGMGVGFGLASLAQLNVPQRICIIMEVGLQNGTIALLIATKLLENDEMAIAPCIYSLWMMVPAAAVVVLRKKMAQRETVLTA